MYETQSKQSEGAVFDESEFYDLCLRCEFRFGWSGIRVDISDNLDGGIAWVD